jgi:multidrug efflux system membrane fusion protein
MSSRAPLSAPHIPKKPFPKQRIALLILGAILLWTFTGIFSDHTPEPASKNAQLLEAPLVKTQLSQAQAFTEVVSVTAYTEGNQMVTLLSKIQGDVTKIPSHEGQLVESGRLLVQLDPQDRPIQMEQAKALLEQRRLEYKVAKSLSKSGYQSATEVAKANAALKQAQAGVKVAEIALNDTQIIAPFSGTVERIYVDQGETVDKNTELVKLVDLSALKVVGYVHESYRAHVKAGSIVQITTNQGQLLQAVLSYVGADADTATRSYRAEALIADNTAGLNSGRTVTMEIPMRDVMAHVIQPSWLSLNKEGKIGLKVLTNLQIAKFFPVEIVSESQGKMWVTGLPQSVRLITFGQAFLKEGDKARISNNTPNAAGQ